MPTGEKLIKHNVLSLKTDNVTFGVCGKPFKRRESFGLLAP